MLLVTGMFSFKGRIVKEHSTREIKGSNGEERRGEENGGGAIATVIYGWSSVNVEACKQNDKWVSSDRVLY